MAITHHKLPLIIIISLVVIFLTPSWITAYGIGDCHNLNCHSSRISEWQQRLWYADIYNFLYGDCECYYASHGVIDPYAGSTPAASVDNARTNSVKTSGEDAASLMDEANVFYLTGSYEQAAESYAKAVNIDPTLSKGWLNLGNSLYFLGRYQASLDAYEALLNREPDNANALAGKNNALLALDKTDH